MDIPLALKNAQHVLCFDAERFFLRDVTNPVFDFIKNSIFPKDCSLSFRVNNTHNQEYTQVQYGGNSAILLYGFSTQQEQPCDLFEALSYEAGSAGKFHLLANVPLDSEQHDLLKSNGFHTYTVQSLWQVNDFSHPAPHDDLWTFSKDEHQSLISSFYTRFISPLESSLQSWNFADVFHLVLQDHTLQSKGIARVRFFADRAVVLPMLDCDRALQFEYLTSLLAEISKFFNTILIREAIHHPLDTSFLNTHARIIQHENHFMVRNLAILNPVKNFQATDFLEDRGIPKPTTPFSHS